MHGDIIKRLQGLTGPATREDVDFCIIHAPWYHDTPPQDPLWSEFVKALYGSLDAAIALVERVLPGWRKRWQDDGDGTHEAFLENKADFGAIDASTTRSFGSTPAIALLLALFRALDARPRQDPVAQEGENG